MNHAFCVKVVYNKVFRIQLCNYSIFRKKFSLKIFHFKMCPKVKKNAFFEEVEKNKKCLESRFTLVWTASWDLFYFLGEKMHILTENNFFA